jgi:hypothetical protein
LGCHGCRQIMVPWIVNFQEKGDDHCRTIAVNGGAGLSQCRRCELFAFGDCGWIEFWYPSPAVKEHDGAAPTYPKKSAGRWCLCIRHLLPASVWHRSRSFSSSWFSFLISWLPQFSSPGPSYTEVLSPTASPPLRSGAAWPRWLAQTGAAFSGCRI